MVGSVVAHGAPHAYLPGMHDEIDIVPRARDDASGTSEADAGMGSHERLDPGDTGEHKGEAHTPATAGDACDRPSGDGMAKDDPDGSHEAPPGPTGTGPTGRSAPLVSDILAEADKDAMIAELLDVVVFYAEPGTYQSVTFRSSAPRGGFDSDRGGAGSSTFGRRAREVLARPSFAGLIKATLRTGPGMACPDCGVGILADADRDLSFEHGNGTETITARIPALVCSACGAAFTDERLDDVRTHATIEHLTNRALRAEARAAIAPEPDSYEPSDGELEVSASAFDPVAWTGSPDGEPIARRRAEVRERMRPALKAAARARWLALSSTLPVEAPPAASPPHGRAETGMGDRRGGETEGPSDTGPVKARDAPQPVQDQDPYPSS